MRYKVTLNNKVYEVEVEETSAMLVDEYEALAPVSPAAPAAAPVAVVAGGAAPAAAEEEVKEPPKEPCTEAIPGVEVMDLEDAVKVLWKAGIYAESGMGCTGPLVMMSPANLEKSRELLKAAGYIG